MECDGTEQNRAVSLPSILFLMVFNIESLSSDSQDLLADTMVRRAARLCANGNTAIPACRHRSSPLVRDAVPLPAVADRRRWAARNQEVPLSASRSCWNYGTFLPLGGDLEPWLRLQGTGRGQLPMKQIGQECQLAFNEAWIMAGHFQEGPNRYP